MALRAFNIRQDLDIMIPLIKGAFHYPENDDWNLKPDEITSLVDSMTTMRSLYPVLQIGGLFNPSLKSMMCGYIWEEEGQPVGLVNLSPQGGDEHIWAIGNVAVLPEHRRKGIAQGLIAAAVDLARQHGVKNVVLEVIADNQPAVNLYKHKGFETYSETVQLNRGSARSAPPLMPLPEGYRLEKYGAHGWQERYTLMKRITPVRIQQFEPVHVKKFRRSLVMRLLRSIILALGPVMTTTVLVRHQAADQIVARLACYLRKKPGGINEIEIDLDPAHAILAPYLVANCVHNALNASPGHDIELRIAKWQQAVVQSALDIGFVNRAGWLLMGMRLA